ncbi:MAG: FHA domain-containing protein [Lentisphaerae bacterium]|nr:FHA domain-containing protein [Lentisphaerota bacterium]
MEFTIHLEIRRPDRDPKTFEIEPGVYTVGSDPECRIRLPHEEVDSRHAILTIQPDSVWIEDLGSSAGTFVSGNRVRNRVAVKPQEEIHIGPFGLAVRGISVPPPPAAAPAAPPPAPARPATAERAPDVGADPEQDTETRKRQAVKQEIHRELLARLDIKRLTAARIEREDLNKRAKDTITAIVHEVSSRLPSGIREDELIREIYNEAVRLGPLEDLLENEEVTEIMVNGPNSIYVERKGRIERTGMSFMDDSSVLAIIERIVSPIGRRIDESQPYVDARLPDGSRVNAIIHPLSLVGPCLTIRKFSKTPFSDEDMIRFGTLTRDMAEFARICVLLRKNIIVSGGTGSGKTTLLNVLSAYLPPTDRIITIEDAAELRLNQDHVVRLEARPPNIEGRGAITIRDLVRNALRMRPDRIVVGECRGQEALDMLQAMNTGHDGSLTTVHANSPRDVISRMETMVLMAGMDLPVRAIREQITSAVDIIIHESRMSDGSRKVVRITEIVGQEGDQITMQDIFEFTQTGLDASGHVLGRFAPTGAVPTFVEDLAAKGMTINRAMFDPRAASATDTRSAMPRAGLS